MLVMNGTKAGAPVILIGLSHENVRRLLADQPIKLDLSTVLPPPGEERDRDDILLHIFVGPTEADMKAALVKTGTITERTIEHIDDGTAEQGSL